MSKSPVKIFGFIMSFTYVFFGLLFVMTNFGLEMISEEKYRKIFGGALMAYGLFRVTYFLRQLIRKD